ncbi:MAG TPA: hypothetical protein VKR52_21860 [Terracidiphilus sp.]|nr:hypothetical protein [Terracidiphilus sp.]
MSNGTPSVWRERLSSPLTWHYAGLGLLIAIVAVLAVVVGLDWSATDTRSTDALAGKQLELKALTMQTVPLRGLDKRVADTRDQIASFNDRRIPTNYSTVATRIGELEVKSGVRMSRLQYAQGQADSGLTEVNIDAGISGEYPQIMRFVNGLERDPNFFIIRTMTLTGQQGGMVNLRLRFSTWLRSGGLPDGSVNPQAQPAGGVSSAAPEGE